MDLDDSLQSGAILLQGVVVDVLRHFALDLVTMLKFGIFLQVSVLAVNGRCPVQYTQLLAFLVQI